MKIRFKHHIALISLCASGVFMQFAQANSCDEGCDVIIEPPELTPVACGPTSQIFPYKVINLIGKPIVIEDWDILTDDHDGERDGDSWPDIKDLVTIQSSKDCKANEANTEECCELGESFTDECIVNVSINTTEIGSCPAGGLRGNIDRTLRLDIESWQPFAYAPIDLKVTKKGDLRDWTYLGPSVINFADANAQANKNVGQTDDDGFITEDKIDLGPGANFYLWYQTKTMNALANLEAVFLNYYLYYFSSTEISSKLGSNGDEAELAASFYKFNPKYWPVTLDGTLTINGGKNQEAVFVLAGFEDSTPEKIIFSVLQGGKIELKGGIRPENVTFVLDNGSAETEGDCTLVGTYIINNGGFEDEPVDLAGPCYINGSVFVLVDDDDSDPDEPPFDPEDTNINLFGTTANTP